MRTWLPALLIGLATGYAALWLREMGWIIGAAVLILLPVVYLRQRRLADVGWLYLGAGLSPVVLLGRILLEVVTDPAIQVQPDTWIFFAGAVVLAAIGFGVIVSAARRQRTSP
jgi:hypothetical protein